MKKIENELENIMWAERVVADVAFFIKVLIKEIYQPTNMAKYIQQLNIL